MKQKSLCLYTPSQTPVLEGPILVWNCLPNWGLVSTAESENSLNLILNLNLILVFGIVFTIFF